MTTNNEPSVQVPVSLIERTIEALAFEGIDVPELAALLPQPTRSTAPMSEKPHAPSCDGWMEDEGDCTCRPAESPRIEDLAPGTTFWASVDGVSQLCMRANYGDVWSVTEDEWLHLDGDLDPSTIRDVTPPQ